MATSAAQHGAFEGSAPLSYGFRLFLLFGALWAVVAVALWLPMLRGSLVLPSAFAPVEWHVHELIYGCVPAIIAGFDVLRELMLLLAAGAWVAAFGGIVAFYAPLLPRRA
ncbi:MAG: NnrS family protein [Hyphomicrobiaceae bacterium]